jgi:hypothetical protein
MSAAVAATRSTAPMAATRARSSATASSTARPTARRSARPSLRAPEAAPRTPTAPDRRCGATNRLSNDTTPLVGSPDAPAERSATSHTTAGEPSGSMASVQGSESGKRAHRVSRADPAGGRRKSPPAPGNPRKTAGEKPCSCRESPHSAGRPRPVTPEVAGSSPVAPVKKDLQIGISCCSTRHRLHTRDIHARLRGGPKTAKNGPRPVPWSLFQAVFGLPTRTTARTGGPPQRKAGGQAPPAVTSSPAGCCRRGDCL